MKLSILLLLLTYVAISLYAKPVHQTFTNKNHNFKHKNRINGTTEINITASIAPVRKVAMNFPGCTSAQMCGKSRSPITNANNSHTDIQTTTESDLIGLKAIFNFTEKNCSNNETNVGERCVLKFPDNQTTTEPNQLLYSTERLCPIGEELVGGHCVLKFPD